MARCSKEVWKEVYKEVTEQRKKSGGCTFWKGGSVDQVFQKQLIQLLVSTSRFFWQVLKTILEKPL